MADRDSLLRAFGIEAHDLAANREGRLGPGQARNLRSSGVRNLAAAFVGGAVLAAILAFVADRPLVPAQYITAGLLFAVLLAVGFFDLRRTWAAATAGRVEVLRGPIGVVSRGTHGWYLLIAGEEYRLPVRPWHLHADKVYRVYVVPGARRVVAMEPDEENGPG